MTQVIEKARGRFLPLAIKLDFLSRYIFRLLGLAVIDGLALWLLMFLIRDGVWPLAVFIVLATLLVNAVNLSDSLYPLRWMSPALSVIILMILYPIIFTVYTAFTNYSDGHLLTKVQAIRRIGQDRFLPEGGNIYKWAGFRSSSGEIALWLVDEDGQGYFGRVGQPLEPMTPGEGIVSSLDQDGFPESLEGYTRLTFRDILPILDNQLALLEFGEAPNTIKIRSIREAAQLQQRYLYDPNRDAIIDNSIGEIYYADNEQGIFVSVAGKALKPGYQVTIGLNNFQRLFNSPALRGPFVQVFLWTVAFALLSVLTTFAAGLFLALVYNDPGIRGRKAVRTLLLLPYTIPGIIGILIWRGMLNQHLGVITTNMVKFIGWAPGWFTDPWWSKVGVLLVNLWLGYPYMMLVCSGALQAIPSDIYEAAQVDGANSWQRFWRITLPLLLVSVGPLLIASFTFNFNNFTVIYAYNEGRPPIPGTPTPAGYTDILISYTFRLAFESGRGADYGYAAAITIVIFVIVAAITLFQYRFMGRWEEISENV